jgi:hypothetical protein
MEIKSLYAIGGQQKRLGHDQTEWHIYGKGVIVKVDLESGAVESCLEYASPPEARPETDPSILFKAGTVQHGRFYTCTTTEILIYSLPDFEQIGYVTLPMFHDVHHVYPTPQGTLLVAVTGLDMVVEVTWQGQVLREWNVLPEAPWTRFSQEIDYRKVLTTKPHQAHPNFVFVVGDEVWTTRFEQKDAICLTQPERHIPIGVERVHDGVIYRNKVYFTAVDGHVAIADLSTLKVERLINLNEINQADRALGWCRGIHVVDEDQVIVAFSRLRPTKIRENLRWVKSRFQGSKMSGNLPSRVALYDLKRNKLCWEHSLEAAGINAIFSIHPAG